MKTNNKSMSRLVRNTADLLFPFILVFGFYVVLHGHLTPGGGFQGGAVIASAFILLVVAYRYEDIIAYFSKNYFKNYEALGLTLFIGTALSAVVIGYTFFRNYLMNTNSLFGQVIPIGVNSGILNSAGIVPIMNIAVGLEVLGGLSIIVLYMTSGLSEIEEEKND